MYGRRGVGSEVERRVGGMMKVRIVLSALEVRMLVPSGVLEVVSEE